MINYHALSEQVLALPEDEDNDELETKIALVVGYRQLGEQYGKCASHWVSPKNWKQKQDWEGWTSAISHPALLSSVDAVLEVVPEKWVESVYRRFDEICIAKLHPRGDLGLQDVGASSPSMARALLAAVLMALDIDASTRPVLDG